MITKSSSESFGHNSVTKSEVHGESGTAESRRERLFNISYGASTLCRATGAAETRRCAAAPTGPETRTANTRAPHSMLALKMSHAFCPQIARQQQQLLQQQHKINLLQQQIQVRPAAVRGRVGPCSCVSCWCTHKIGVL